MSFDLIYGITTSIFNFITFIFFIVFWMKLKKMDINVFLARIFLKADRFIAAFFALWIAEISLTIGYIVATLMAIWNPYTLIWEYTNISVFFFLMVFFILFTGLYPRRRHKMNGGTPVQPQPSQSVQTGEKQQ